MSIRRGRRGCGFVITWKEKEAIEPPQRRRYSKVQSFGRITVSLKWQRNLRERERRERRERGESWFGRRSDSL